MHGHKKGQMNIICLNVLVAKKLICKGFERYLMQSFSFNVDICTAVGHSLALMIPE